MTTRPDTHADERLLGTDMPWLQAPLNHVLSSWQGHALLCEGERGVGLFQLGLRLAQAWLCESPQHVPQTVGTPLRMACGHCAACHLVSSRGHPDLLVLIPPSLSALPSSYWPDAQDDLSAEGESGEASSKSIKASDEIKVEAVRRVVQFCQQTTARGGHKVVLIHPAFRMNTVAANTLLKTLEEPGAAVRFVLTLESGQTLLPTLRSRCQTLKVTSPSEVEAVSWLTQHGVEDAGLVWRAFGRQVLVAWEAASGAGWRAADWRAWPKQLLQPGSLAPAGWTLAELTDNLQKLWIDLQRVALGHVPLYFDPHDMPLIQGVGSWTTLDQTWRTLQTSRRRVYHPLNADLQKMALWQVAAAALSTAPRLGPI